MGQNEMKAGDSLMNRRILLGVAGLFAVAQLVRPERTNPPERQPVPAPRHVAATLRKACYDCHSNETRWPFYSHVAPFSWLVTNHVKEGRRKLNFSTIRADRVPFEEICGEMRAGRMPMSSYTLVHRDSVATAEETKAVCAWAEENGN